MQIFVLARRRVLLACAVPASATAAGLQPARAAPGGLPTNVGHGDSSPQSEKLKQALFAERAIETAASKVQPIVPLRAGRGGFVRRHPKDGRYTGRLAVGLH